MYRNVHTNVEQLIIIFYKQIMLIRHCVFISRYSYPVNTNWKNTHFYDKMKNV